MHATVIPERLERFLLPDFHLREGFGGGVNGHADVCFMQAVAWLAGESNTDAPVCACPAITRYLIRLNDSRLFAEHRDTLKPFAPRIVGTRRGVALAKKRCLIAVDYAVRIVAPIILRARGKADWAAELEKLPRIKDRASAEFARDATQEIRRDSCYADVTTTIAADAADDAYRVAGSNSYAADAAYLYSAAGIGDSAAGISSTVKVSGVLRSKSLDCLEAMLRAGSPP